MKSGSMSFTITTYLLYVLFHLGVKKATILRQGMGREVVWNFIARRGHD